MSHEYPPCTGQCCQGAARISTLEARIAELERERDEARGTALLIAASEGKRVAERNDAQAACLEASQEIGRLQGVVIRHETAEATVRADRDEAVQLLRKLHRWHGGTASLKKAIDAYLALHPAQPETPGKETP